MSRVRNVAYALGEVLLIFLGITLALSFGNWNEERRLRQTETRTLVDVAEDHLNLINGQVIDYVERLGMLPKSGEARAVTERYGTYRFCKAQRLPMRSFKDAMQAVPN